MRQHKTDDDSEKAETLAEMILGDGENDWINID